MKTKADDLAFSALDELRPHYTKLTSGPTYRAYGQNGFSKREFIAAMALQGIISDPKADIKGAALMAVVCADELIKRLNEERP